VDFERLERMTRTIGLEDAVAAADELLAGRVRGRVVVKIGRA
jgi:acrylyl-CoA reductase (NADPH)